jgi:hypothetical protein
MPGVGDLISLLHQSQPVDDDDDESLASERLA